MNRNQRRAAARRGGAPIHDDGLGRLFDEALRYHQAGHLAEAEARYRQILARDSRHADSLHLLGVMASQVGRHDVAVDLIGRAIAIDAKAETYHSNLGFAFQNLGRLAEAEASYRQAVRLRPRFPEAHNNLGNILYGRKHLAEAEAAYRQAIACKADYPEAHNNLGLALKARDRTGEALDCYRRAIGLRADYAEAHNNLATALQSLGRLDEAAASYRAALDLAPDDAEVRNNLGTVLQKLDRWDEARACFLKALDLKPDYPEANFNLGNVLQESDHLAAAIACYRRAVVCRPDYPEAHNRLGRALHLAGDVAWASACFRRAIACDPDAAAVYDNWGVMLGALGRFDQALAAFRNALALDPAGAEIHNDFGVMHHADGRQDAAEADYLRAIACDPGHAEAHWNLGLVRLLRGDYRSGWDEYEWRWKCNTVMRRILPAYEQPAWTGEAGRGRTILLWAEQGAGDTLQFVRFVPQVIERGWRVVLGVPPSLARLARTIPDLAVPDLAVVVEGETLPPFDVHCPLMGLPPRLDLDVGAIPSAAGYLAADPDVAGQWRTRLAGLPGRKVGVVWRGNPVHARDRHRSLDPAWLSPALDLPGLSVVSLQKDGRPEEFASLGLSCPFLDAGPHLGDYAETAALIANLDLLISVDTSVVHLAGAMGRPVWTLLDFVCDWRWLEKRPDSPWYSSMRLFRQARPGDWAAVAAEVRAALAGL